MAPEKRVLLLVAAQAVVEEILQRQQVLKAL
jgi:hypothetical protein